MRRLSCGVRPTSQNTESFPLFDTSSKAMDGIKAKLIHISQANHMVFTAELAVQRDQQGQQSVNPPSFR